MTTNFNGECSRHFMPPWPEMPFSFIVWLVNALTKMGYRQVQCPVCATYYFKHRLQLEQDQRELAEFRRDVGFRAFDAEI